MRLRFCDFSLSLELRFIKGDLSAECKWQSQLIKLLSLKHKGLDFVFPDSIWLMCKAAVYNRSHLTHFCKTNHFNKLVHLLLLVMSH